MSNILALFRGDLKRLTRNVVSVIIAIGLVVMPSIFAWYNIIACWDAFGQTGNLKVAVANEDAGYQSDLVPLRVNVGEQVVSALRANEDIDWVFTDGDDAVDGARSGRYYAAVVIPEDFSRDMLTFYSRDAEHARIVYYANEKKNAIAPKVTGQGADIVSYQVNEVFAETLSEVALAIAEALSDQADQAGLEGRIAALVERLGSIGEDASATAEVMGLYGGLIGTTQRMLSASSGLVDEMQQGADSLAGRVEEGAAGLGEQVGALRSASAEAADALGRAAQGFRDLASALEALPDNEAAAAARQAALDAAERMEGLKASFEGEVAGALDALASGCDQVAQGAHEGLDHVKAAAEGLRSALGAMGGALEGAQGQVDSIAAALRSTASDLDALKGALASALASGDADQLRSLLDANVETLSAALAAPVEVERIAVFPVESFGSAMAPLYTTLALYIGSLLILVVVRPTVSRPAQRALHDPKPRELFLGRFCVMGALSLCQTALMALGNLFFLQVQAAHPWLLLLCFWVAGLVFTFMIYALVAAFANLGKAIAVLLLIVQVTGCGGSFPLQMMPWFVQALSPWLPATHVVDAMRAAMMGTYGADYWVALGELALFVVPAALIGLVLRKPLARFMGWYVEEVEASKLIG